MNNTMIKVLKAGDELYDSVNDTANTGMEYIVKDIIGADRLSVEQKKDIAQSVLAACLMAVMKTMAYQEFIQYQTIKDSADSAKH